jgi:hypothetical protein
VNLGSPLTLIAKLAPSTERAMTEVPQLAQNCRCVNFNPGVGTQHGWRGGTHLVCYGALPERVASESAVLVAFHDTKAIFRGEGPEISILESMQSNIHRNTYIIMIGTR